MYNKSNSIAVGTNKENISSIAVLTTKNLSLDQTLFNTLILNSIGYTSL